MATATGGGYTAPIKRRYANRLILALTLGGLAIVAFGVVAYVEVIASIADPSLRAEVLSAFLGVILTATISLALVGVTVGSNTAITLGLLSSKARRIADGDRTVTLDTTREDEIGDLAESLAEMRDSLQARIEEAERRREEAERLNEHMQTKAEHYESVLADVTDGDLSRRADASSDNEAIASIGEAINYTVAELEEATVAIAEQMEQLSATSEEVAAAADELVRTSERARESGETGLESTRSAIAEIEAVERDTEATVEEIEALSEEMEAIEDIVGVITEIAQKTNILAVNARIESSRSAESGSGYSVVADEIRELAEDTKDAAEDIERRIRRVRSTTDDTVEGISRTSERVEEAATTVTRAGEALDTLVDYVEDVDENVKNISDATDGQARSVQTVATMVARLSTADAVGGPAPEESRRARAAVEDGPDGGANSPTPADGGEFEFEAPDR